MHVESTFVLGPAPMICPPMTGVIHHQIIYPAVSAWGPYPTFVCAPGHACSVKVLGELRNAVLEMHRMWVGEQHPRHYFLLEVSIKGNIIEGLYRDFNLLITPFPKPKTLFEGGPLTCLQPAASTTRTRGKLQSSQAVRSTRETLVPRAPNLYKPAKVSTAPFHSSGKAEKVSTTLTLKS